MLTHHINSPSSLHRRRHCPGSARMERGRPELPSEYAEEGRVLHAAVWNRELRANLSAEQLEALAVCDKVLAALNVSAWHAEERAELFNGFDLLTWGTPDGWGVAEDDGGSALYVVDFKFGRLEVDAPEENDQLGAYCAALMNFTGIAKAHAIIVQPRLWPPTLSFTFTDAVALTGYYQDIIAATERPELVLCAGDWCKYCKAQFDCPAVQQKVQALAEVPPAMITAQNAAEMYVKAKHVDGVIRLMLKHIRDMCVDAYERGEALPPGLSFTEKQGNREITDIQGAYDAVHSLYTERDFMRLCKIPVGAFLEDCTARLVDLKVCRSLKDAKKWFSEHVPVERGKPKLELATVGATAKGADNGDE